MKFLLRVTGPIAFWLSWPLSYVYVRHTERTRVVLRAEGKILLVRVWHGPGGWSLPGGGLHRGETSLQAAARETLEETGLEIATEALQDLGLKAYAHAGLVFTSRYYSADLPVALRPTAGLPEVLDAKWILESELRNIRLMPDVRQGLRAHRQATRASQK